MASGAIPNFDDFVTKEKDAGGIPSFDEFAAKGTPAPATPPAPAPPKFVSDPRARVGQWVTSAAKGVADVLNPMPLIKQYASEEGIRDVLTGGPAGPIARGIIDSAVDQGKQAYESAKKGRYSEAVGHGIAAFTPGVGPMAAQAADTMAGSPGTRDKYGNEITPAVEPDIPRGVGQAAALLGGPRATQALAEVAGGAGTAIKSRLTRIDPKQGMMQGLKPRSTNLGFDSALDRAMPELKQTEAVAGTPITNVGQLDAAIKLSKQRIWGQYEKIAGPQAQRGIDASGVARAMLESIPEKAAAQNPSIVRRVQALADAYSKPLTIQQLEEFLQTTNAELDSHYAKYPASKGVDLRGKPLIAARAAEAATLRDVLYNALDDAAEGAAPRELKQRYGALMNIEREVQRRQNVAARQQPDSLSEQVGKWSGIGDIAKGGVRVLAGDVRGGLADAVSGVAKRDAAKWLKEQQTTDALIRRSFENYQGEPAPIQMPPRFSPRALLPAANQSGGTMYTPPPADLSGVRSVPGMTQPLNPRRALPAPDIITPPPADASYVRGAQGMAQPPNPARALPPRSTIITQAPPDASGVRAVPAMTQPPNPARALPAPGRPPQEVIDLDIGSQFGDRLLDPRAVRPRNPPPPPILRPRQ